jgi:pimeloyl-ACP methyl ester carboxylesterase
MRGHGDSPKSPAGEYSLRRTADDAAEFIVALHLEQPLLIGHSWGGATALVLASGAGSEVVAPAFSKIVLEDPAYNFGRGNPVERAINYTKDIGRPAADVRAELLVNSPGWTKADIDGKLDALSKVSREAVISVFEQGSDVGNLLPLLANLTSPTLLLRADPDGGTTLSGASWEEAQTYMHAPSQAVQINGASHNIHRSKFEAFMQAVNDFLRM